MKNSIKKNINYESGLTLIETLITVAIFGVIIVAVFIFQRDIFKLNKVISSGLSVQQNTNRVLKPIISEIRSATISNIGAYPISIATSSAIEFYSDTDNDGLAEKIRYYLENNELKRSEIIPKGNPLIYDNNDADVSLVIKNVVNETNPIFEFYDENYYGSTSSSPLHYPVSLTDIRLIKITLLIDDDPQALPGYVVINGHAMLRNLKDN